jgi:hypothetical protein
MANLKNKHAKIKKRPRSARPIQPHQARANSGGHGGKREGAGRPKGSENVYSREIKEAVIGAANDLGEDGAGSGGMRGYMRFLGREHPAVFGGMLRGVMGMQITVERPQVHMKTADEVRKELEGVGLRLEDFSPFRYHTAEEVLELTADDITDDTGGK